MLKRMFTVAAATFALGLSAIAHSPSSKDIVDTAVGAGQFKTLAKLLTDAGLVETLKGEGPFTVFAPTDEAFSRVDKRTLDALKKDKNLLRRVLTYHVVSGKVMAADAVKLNGKTAKTVSGDNIRVTVRNNNVMINDARVVAADVQASNGVIHVINRVLIPPTHRGR